MYVEIMAPRSWYSRQEIWVNFTAPDGTMRSGTVGTHYDDYIEGLPEGKWPGRYSGDVQPSHPGVVATYPYLLFENVSYNGTWRLEYELLVASSMAEDLTGLQQGESVCARAIFSQPDTVPVQERSGNQYDYISDGVMLYDWTLRQAVPGAEGAECNSEPTS